MVSLNRIYTRTGDTGNTALGDGTRVSKGSNRVAAYGTVDELNSTVGLARLDAGELDAMLGMIQNDLFDLGADLCVPHDREREQAKERLRIQPGQVERLEGEIDQANERLSPLKSFVLPGGSTLSARLHQCRTVTRRAERLCVDLSECEEVNSEAIRYLNRLSDWFFVMARIANDEGRQDVLWVPGGSR